MRKGTIILDKKNQKAYYIKASISGKDGRFALIQELGNPYAQTEFIRLKKYTILWTPNEINKRSPIKYSQT